MAHPVSTKHIVPAAAVTEPLDDTLDPESFTPRLLALLSNILVWRESHALRKNFGMGTSEWRILSTLAIRPGLPSGDVANFLGVNKAIVSKSTTVLVERELIVLGDGPRGSRPMFLTDKGAQTHEDMRPLSVLGHDFITQDLTADEISTLNEQLQQMLSRARELYAIETAPTDSPHPAS